MLTISDLVKMSKTAAEKPQDSVVEKTAKEAGMTDAEQLTKLASHMGELIGRQAFATFMEKMADVNAIAPGGLSAAGTGQVAADKAEDDQTGRLAVHNAELAVTSANDAVKSLEQGDEHTANAMFATAAGAIETAKALAAKACPEVQAKVNEAAAAVSGAANTAKAKVAG